jgi:hypothetical protein
MTRAPWLAMVLLGAALPARAQLIRNQAAAKPWSEMTPSEVLADLAGKRMKGETLPPVDAVDDDGVPSLMVAYTKSAWKHEPRMADKQVEHLRPYAKEFAEAWKKFEERKAVADAAVAEAAELEKSGKLAEAAQRLGAALTIPDRDASGNLPAHGRLLEANDAEYPVLEALVRVCGKRKDFATASDAVALMKIRQKPLAQVDERVVWILEQLSKNRFDFTIYSQMERQLPDPNKRSRAADEQFIALSQYGLHPIAIDRDKTVKAGDWVLFRMEAQNLSDTGASSKYHYVGMQSYDCHDTGKLASYDRSTGQFHYYESCKQKKVTEDQSLDVKLKTPPPPWAKSGRDVPIIGRVKKAGPHWQIEDAFVTDRWLGTVAPVPGKL